MTKICLIFMIVFLIHFSTGNDLDSESKAEQFFFKKGGNHTNNWAVIVSTSKFWFNYRHASNALGIYRMVKKLGIPDSQIILMLPDDMSCNPRNIMPGVIIDSADSDVNLYGDDVEVDYRGYDVTVENMIRVITGRHDADVPRTKRLMSDSSSNVLVYMTGHGGDKFLKFQDYEEITSNDLADAFEQMYLKKRYNELLFIVDTCQANTLFDSFYSPNILSMGSARREESSFAYKGDKKMGISLIDRFSYYTLEYLRSRVDFDSNISIQDLFSSYDSKLVYSHPDWRDDYFSRPISDIYITEFFGHVTPVEITAESYSLTKNPSNQPKPPTEKSRDLSQYTSRKNTLSSPAPLIIDLQTGALSFLIILLSYLLLSKKYIL